MATRLKVTSNFSFMKLAGKLPETLQSSMNNMAQSAVRGAKERIDKGLSPPLRQSTIELRQERGTGGTKPLYETGALHRSIKLSRALDKSGLSTAGVGVNMLEYGWHQHKGFTSKNVPIGFKNGKPQFLRNKKISKKVPARPFIFPSEKDLTDSLQKTMININKALHKRKVIT